MSPYLQFWCRLKFVNIKKTQIAYCNVRYFKIYTLQSNILKEKFGKTLHYSWYRHIKYAIP